MRQAAKDQRDTFLSSFSAYITALSFRTCTLNSLRAQMLLPEASCPKLSATLGSLLCREDYSSQISLGCGLDLSRLPRLPLHPGTSAHTNPPTGRQQRQQRRGRLLSGLCVLLR